MATVLKSTASQIGCKLDAPTMAHHNATILKSYISSSAGKIVDLYIGGDLHVDLAGGGVRFATGAGHLSGIYLNGPGRIMGVNAPQPTTPVLVMHRGAGTILPMVVRDLDIESEGSGILWPNGGSMSLIDRVRFRNIGGRGDLDMEGFGDLTDGRCGFALRVDDSDGLFVKHCAIEKCAGHGIISSRWHAGILQCYARECGGSGFKLQQANGLDLDARAESNFGYGLHIRDSGINCYENRKMRANDGGFDKWRLWCEANNGRGVGGSHGYRFSQLKFENVAGREIFGHSGWSDNAVRVDACSRDLNYWADEFKIPNRAPDLDLTSSSFVLPHDGYGDRRITNWNEVWTDEQYRPRVARSDDGLLITWPIGSLDKTSVQKTAYWNPFGRSTLAGPGTFAFASTLSDTNGSITDYCIRREQGTPRQTPCTGVLTISPIAGAITGVMLWDKMPHRFTGAASMVDPRTDIGLHFNAWAPGMQNAGNAGQVAEHIMQMTELSLWKL